MAVDDPFDMDWPDFDPLSKCVKCGHEIAQPEPVPEKPVAEKPAAKPKPKSETAAEEPPKPTGAPKPAMALPVKAPPPTCAYCNGEDCPCFEDEVPEHMHQFCDCCGYEWIAKTLDAS
jgi:hypothetical protein